MKHEADGLFFVTPAMVSQYACGYGRDSFTSRFARGRTSNDTTTQIPVTADFLIDVLRNVSGANIYWLWDRVEHIASGDRSDEFQNAIGNEGYVTVIMDVLADYAREHRIGRLPPKKKLKERTYEVILPGTVRATSPESAARKAAEDAGVDMVDVVVREVRGRQRAGTNVYVNL